MDVDYNFEHVFIENAKLIVDLLDVFESLEVHIQLCVETCCDWV